MKKISFRIKLFAICLLLSAVSATISYFAYTGLNQVEQTYAKVTDSSMPNLESLNEMYLSYRSVRINLRTLGLPGLTKEQADQYIKRVHEAIAAYEKEDKVYVSAPFVPGEKELYDKLNSTWIKFKEIGSRALAHYEAGTPEAKAALIKIFLEDCPSAAKEFTAAMEELRKFQLDLAKEFVTSAKSTAANTTRVVLLVALVGIAMGLILGFVFARAVSGKIQQVVSDLVVNADKVSLASSEIAQSSSALSSASTEQAASLEETAASLEEITAMIAKATENAEETARSSEESQKKTEEGKSAVEKMLSSMGDISQSNEAILGQISESNKQLEGIVHVIRDIGTKTKVINEIVFQTKLLSFNASVEAARAGEHGKGFSVVAEEVGNLARMSGSAAKEISDMLDGSISKVETIVIETKSKVEDLVRVGKEKVDTGVEVANLCAEVLNEIVQNVSKVSTLSVEISNASKEQSQGVSEINKAMSQLDVVTQQNSTSSENASHSASDLAVQATSLKQSVERLAELVSGESQSVSTKGPEPKATSLKRATPAVGALQNRSLKIVASNETTKKAKSETEVEPSGFRAVSGDTFVPSADDSGFME